MDFACLSVKLFSHLLKVGPFPIVIDQQEGDQAFPMFSHVWRQSQPLTFDTVKGQSDVVLGEGLLCFSDLVKVQVSLGQHFEQDEPNIPHI